MEENDEMHPERYGGDSVYECLKVCEAWTKPNEGGYARSAKTGFIESFPFNIIQGILMIGGTLLLEKINANVILNIALVMIVNAFCYQIANYVFVIAKHNLRIRLCRRLGLEPSEDNIAVMESLEYQSV